MHSFKLAVRSLFRRGNSNIIKILCLAAGLALGLLLIAKVCYERSYNDFIADADRIYVIESTFNRGGDQGSYTFPRVSGGVLPAIREELPQIETGTHMVDDGINIFINEDNDSIKAASLLVDSLFLHTLSLPMVAGNSITALSDPYNVMISRSLADKLGGPEKAMGQRIYYNERDGVALTVSGIFEDLPDNTHFDIDALLSIVHMGERSLNNWYGNDRYESYIKVLPGTDITVLEADIRKVQGKHVDLEEMERNGDLHYTLKPLLDIHAADPDVKASTNFMLTLGILLIAMAVFNYILLVVSTMVARSKATAIEKCYGAGMSEIARRTLAEVTLHMLIALSIAATLVWVFKGTVMKLLDVNLSSLFAPSTIWILTLVIALILVVAVAVPSVLYARVPVAVAFRGSIGSNRWWKLALLFLQFVGVSFLTVVMAFMAKQYDYVFKADAGYSYKNLAYAWTGRDYEHHQAIKQEALNLPFVEQVAFCSQPIWQGASGNNVKLTGTGDEILNFADLYSVTDNYFDVLEIPIVEGEVFPSGQLNDNKIMVSRSFARQVGNIAGWADGAIGKKVIITEHSRTGDDYFTIIGVYEDFRIGSMDKCEIRPSVIFYDLNGNSDFPPAVMLIKTSDTSYQALSQISQAVESNAESIFQVMERQFEKDKNLRDSLMICCAVALVIALAGLVGYSIDEVNRRKREIAIRKVNGAESSDVVRVMCKDVAILSVPAIAIGSALGYLSGMHWLENFSRTSPLSALQIVGIGVAMFALIVACVAFRAAKAANLNPTEIINSND